MKRPLLLTRFMMKTTTDKEFLANVLIVISLLLGVAFVVLLAVTGITDADELISDIFEGPDTPITGAAQYRAGDAALEYMGEGSVSGTEVNDEDGFYEVEITKENGRQIDIHLDESFEIIGHKVD